MIVFLLLVIIAILLFGAGVFLRAGAAVLKVAFATLIIALVMGLLGDVPAWALVVAALPILAALLVALFAAVSWGEDVAKAEAVQTEKDLAYLRSLGHRDADLPTAIERLREQRKAAYARMIEQAKGGKL